MAGGEDGGAGGRGLLSSDEARKICIEIACSGYRPVAGRETSIAAILSVTMEGNGGVIRAITPSMLQEAPEGVMCVQSPELAQALANTINQAFRTRGYTVS